MSRAPPPVIERPQRHSMFRTDSGSSPGAQNRATFNPLTNFQLAFSKPVSSDSPNPNALIPRQPVVHFFVCDHGNAKVKAFTDQFIELLTENGIKVFPELYLTHQPGYQVRAASFNTTADFFFQIHSNSFKTAGPGIVRIYIDGQPQRMTTQEAILYVWSTWRLKCGALSKAETDSLTPPKILYLLEHFADIKPDSVQIEEIQKQLRDAIANGQSTTQCFNQLHTIAEILENGKNKLSEVKLINSEFKSEPGVLLSRCPNVPIVAGLSAPLKEVLISIIEQTQKKVSILISIAQNHAVNETEQFIDEEDSIELEIPDDQQQSTSNWGLMIESVEDHQTSLSSFGDPMGSQGFMAMAPHFILDDF